MVKLQCNLFSDTEPHDNNIQFNQMHTYQADRKAWIDPHREELM